MTGITDLSPERNITELSIVSDICFVSDDNDPLPKKIYERDFQKMAMRKFVKDVMKWLHLR